MHINQEGGDKAAGLSVLPPAQSLTLPGTEGTGAPTLFPLEESSTFQELGRAGFEHTACPTQGPQGPLKPQLLPTALPAWLFAQGIKLRPERLPSALRPSPSRPLALRGALPLAQATLHPLPASRWAPSPVPIPTWHSSSFHLLKVNCGGEAGGAGGQGGVTYRPCLRAQSRKLPSLQAPVGREPDYLAHSCIGSTRHRPQLLNE